jgi:hypothetical protein
MTASSDSSVRKPAAKSMGLVIIGPVAEERKTTHLSKPILFIS